MSSIRTQEDPHALRFVSPMAITGEEMEEFKSEAFELLDVAEKNLLAVGSATDFRSTFDAVFRCYHNLKGAAGMLELTSLQVHMHELETAFMKFKESATIPPESVDYFLNGIDGARALLNGQGLAPIKPSLEVENTPSELVPCPGTTPAVSFVDFDVKNSTEEFFVECGEIIDRIAAALKKIESTPLNGNHYETTAKEAIHALYREFHSLKGSAFLFSFNRLGQISHVVETYLEPVREGTQPLTRTMVDGIYSALKVIELEIRCLKTGQTNEKISELVAALEKALSGAPNPMTTTKASPQPAASVLGASPAPSEKETENSSIRVPVSLLDNLMTLMGEMVLVRNQVLQFSNSSDDLEFSNLSKRLNAVTSEIQDGMMKTRMQPIGNVLSKFNRVVRDLSQELHKNISLSLSGAETELDKSLLEAIKDPLTHIVRNSCDHGIETPEVRLAAGKPAAGTITIKSFHEGGQVVIEINDDGKGLHKDVLLKKAIEKGLITENQAKSLAEREIFNLIFAPGFSTAKQVTNVSGRGVGMDVVRTNIEKIGGTVDLISSAGRGTKILIKIPLTLAIVPALIVNSGNGIFAIPQVKLVELVRVDQSSNEHKIEFIQGSPVYRLRGNLLPLVDLNKILGFPKSEGKSTTSYVNIAVLNAENRSFGLIVDEVQDTADIVVKPLNRILKSLQVYSGATILGDGSVALILDVLGLSKHAQIGRDERAVDSGEVVDATQNRQALQENQDYILVQVSSQTKHAIVLGYVHRLEEFKKSEIEYLGDRRVIRYRDTLLHIVNANTQLGYPAPIENTRDTTPIIVVERAGSLFGIEVDEILDTLSTHIDPQPGLTHQTGIYGTISTANELIVVLEPFELIARAFGEAVESRASTPSTATATTQTALAPTRLKILLAEDTVFFKKAITLVLSKAGHEVTHAHDGQEALDLFNQSDGQFDLIVSDIEMPRMNGFDLAKNIRRGGVQPQIPMLAISSRANASYLAQGAEAGFNLYMEKLKPDFLLKSVSELVRSGKKAA